MKTAAENELMPAGMVMKQQLPPKADVKQSIFTLIELLVNYACF